MGLLTPRCESCQNKSDEVIVHRSGKKLCPSCAAATDAYMVELSKITLSTGSIDRKYTIVQVVMNIATGTDGWNTVFARILQLLRADAHRLQCDAIINLNLNYRIYVDNNKAGLELFAYGTAIKFL